MSKQPIALKSHLNEGAVTERFLDDPNEQSFEDLFYTLSPLLVAYFRSRRCDTSSAEDLAQEVMLTVYTIVRCLEAPYALRERAVKAPLS